MRGFLDSMGQFWFQCGCRVRAQSIFCWKNFKTWKGLIFIKLMATGCSLPYFCSFVSAFLRSFDYGFTFTNTTWKNETGAAVETTLVGRCSLRQGLLKNQFFLGMSRRFSVEIFRFFTGNTIILKIASFLINIFFYFMQIYILCKVTF